MDNLDAAVLKELSEELSEPLMLIFGNPLKAWEATNSLKTAHTICVI